MSRNYGWGSRNAHDAVRMKLYREAVKGSLSFLSAQTITERFARFHRFMKAKQIGTLEHIDRNLVVEFGTQLAIKVVAGKLSPAYAQNLVSGVNTILRIARGSSWASVSPTKDCHIKKRRAVRELPTLTSEQYEKVINHLRQNGQERAACTVELAYTFGLRSKEASLLDTRQALKELNHHFDDKFNVSKGTKGGKKRKILAQHMIERDVLERALKVQGNGRSIMPKSDTWKSWRNNGLRQGREVLHSFNVKGYHEFRAAYAARRYEKLVEWQAPCNGGEILDKLVDLEAREKIARELGHGRVDVVSSYVGRRK